MERRRISLVIRVVVTISRMGASWVSQAERVQMGTSSNGNESSLSFRLGNLQKYVKGEHVAAGWPAWLDAVADKAVHGRVPLRPNA